MLFELKIKETTIVDGHKLDAGTVVAILDTTIDSGNLQSLLMTRSILFEAVKDESPTVCQPPAPTSPIAPKPPKSETVKVTNSDPDAVNEQDNKAEIAEVKTVLDSKIDPSLDGLSTRIQNVLTEQGYGTREKIVAYVASGEHLERIKDIGKKAAAEIRQWIESSHANEPHIDTDVLDADDELEDDELED